MARIGKFKSGGGEVYLALGDLTPKQKLFTQARTLYVCYGGARGGGKSHVARWKAVAGALSYPGIRILMVRREYPELEQTMILPLRQLLPPQLAAYNGSMRMLFFANGSVIKFGHYGMGDDLEYQGQEYDWIFMDEATQFTERQFRILGACLRGPRKIPKRYYLTCNPGGIGHFWVKRLFIDREYTGRENGKDYTFIPAGVQDNPHLNDTYILSLEMQPEDLRRAWLYGDWDALSGQYFPEFRKDIHVFNGESVTIPREWTRYRAIDYGLDMFACLWIARDFDGRSWVYREVQRPDLVVSDAAELMQDMTPPWEPVSATLAPPDIWNRQKDTGRSMAELFMQNGIGLIQASSSRVHGWMALKELLKVQPDEKPYLMISDQCKDLIDHLSQIQHDEKKPEDCATNPHDLTHDVDALRYYAVTYLMTPERPAAAPNDPTPDLAERVTPYDEAMTGGDADDSYLTYGSG